MSYLEDKSEFNLKAAQILIAEELYAPSVHCAYYAMLQFMICQFVNYSGKSFDDVSKESKEKGSSHNYIINGMIDYIKSTYRSDPKIDRVQRNVKDTNIHRLHTKIKDIKKFRVKSDYRNISIEKDEGEKVYKWSLEVKAKIKEFL